MKICILGNGHIGAGLGRAWARKGHKIVFGSRTPEQPELVLLCKETGAQATSISSSVKDVDVVVLAVPYPAVEEVLKAVGDLAGKLVMDCTNAVAPGFTLKYGHTTSAAEELQKQIPKAHVFKSFNAQGAENLANPVYDGVKATNFFCGDDAAGKKVLKALVEDVGFEAVDAGPLKNSRLLEPLMMLWVTAAQSLGTRDIAFKLLRR